MAQDKVSLFNLAIAATQQRGKKLSDPEEKDRRAEECRLWYEPVRNQIMRAAFWPACKLTARLAVLAERSDDTTWVDTDPEPGWRFAYSVPTDYLYPRYLTDYSSFSTGVYKTQKGPVKCLFTSAENATLIYSSIQSSIALWDEQLYLAIAHGLGAYIAGPLTGKASIIRDARNMANTLILDARASALNEEQGQYASLPEWFTARGYSEAPELTRYIHPFGQLLGAHVGGGNVG